MIIAGGIEMLPIKLQIAQRVEYKVFHLLFFHKLLLQWWRLLLLLFFIFISPETVFDLYGK